MIVLFIAIGIVWYCSGVAGFLFWWTRDFDFTTKEVPTACMIGLMGLFAWPVGIFIHGIKGNKVIIGKRQ
jgi:hypothetical protein